MSSLIMTMRWMEPCPGEDARVAVLTDAEADVLQSAVKWLEDAAGDDWGDTIPRVDLFETTADGGDVTSLKEALQHVATGCRYDTDEGLYDEDCPAFAEHGIARS